MENWKADGLSFYILTRIYAIRLIRRWQHIIAEYDGNPLASSMILISCHKACKHNITSHSLFSPWWVYPLIQLKQPPPKKKKKKKKQEKKKKHPFLNISSWRLTHKGNENATPYNCLFALKVNLKFNHFLNQNTEPLIQNCSIRTHAKHVNTQMCNWTFSHYLSPLNMDVFRSK